jgi:serine/threonine-protein kinase
VAQAQEEIPKIERLLHDEFTMASSVPTAVHTWVVWRRHNLTKIKGIGMEYVDGGDLFAFLSNIPTPTPCSDDLVLLASRVCFAVAQAHEIGILHGDVKSPNVLLKRTPEGSVIPLLCDFGVARRLPSRNRCVERESTYAAPETLLASAENPVEYSFSMDSWSLGLTVLDIVYGVRATQKVFDRDSGVSVPGESVVKFLRDLPLKRPEVDEVILNLMKYNPADRWTAMQASEALLAALR